ncbi:MAG: HAMP domain-containing histidine kinase, partial [Lachnospiraceae bacterium]|nr:HAMP domain-containing histidine kinase [Lachnospiraceae bacterium]
SVLQRISQGDTKAKVLNTSLHGDNEKMAQAVNEIGQSVQNAVSTSMKDEKMKADLITNVSHDLKTPLTSIISYVDLLKNEDIKNENAQNYIAILDEKSQRLKQLTDDLVEVSKISSGNIVLQNEPLNVKELLNQAVGEFYEKFEEKKLDVINALPDEPVMIKADSRSIYRVIENLFMNIYKYALEGTRVYLEVTKDTERSFISVKNISANPLGITAEELTERFIRGDESRSSEGAGLGLSIAKSLTEAMNGSFRIVIDGDLFKVELGMPNA